MTDRFCDLHCDTLYEAGKRKENLIDFSGHISFEKLSSYTNFIQVFAMWSENDLSDDEAYDAFPKAAERLTSELDRAKKKGYKLSLAKSGDDIIENEKNGYSSIIFAVEGAKLLGDDMSRLDLLYESGVRILTLVWAGECKLGGAHDNEKGLSEFGLEVVRRCFELGIIPDVSHANAKSTSQVTELAKKYGAPILATHSNALSVRLHTRNLSDEHYSETVKLGGVVGVSMACEHLTDGAADISDVVKHIKHYHSIDPGGVCLGCDFDGVTRLPRGIKDVTSLRTLASALEAAGLDENDVDRIMYKNARDFLVKNLGRKYISEY